MSLPILISTYTLLTSLEQGLDEAAKIPPPRYKHRRTPSQQSNASPTTPNFEIKSPKTNGVNGTKGNGSNGTNVVLERNKDAKDGNDIISIKLPGYEENLRTDKREATLVSGRKAGQRWHTSGLRFAPLNVPLQRRLQTFAVLFHTLSIALCVSNFFFLCAIPLFWPILIPYMIYCMTSKASISGTLSHRSDFLRSLPFWSLFASYFPARLHRTQELPPTRKYIFGYHPHGIISHGAFAAFATEALGFSQLFPGIKNTLLTLDANFRIPIYRDYALAMGLASVSKESCENLLSRGGPNKVCNLPLTFIIPTLISNHRRAWVVLSQLL
jgi:2-acylglycerol O-acyltransferase 2